MMRKIITCLLLIIIFGHLTKCYSTEFKIVIVRENGDEINLITDKEIEKYNWQIHQISIKESYLEKLASIIIHEGDRFIIYLGDKLICTGIFINAIYSSFDRSEPIIFFGADNRLFMAHFPKQLNFKILCYYCEPEGHPLNNEDLYVFLKEKNLLLE